MVRKRADETVELRIDAPTVLLVARGEKFADALRLYLNRHEIQVETATPDQVADSAFVIAPDLIVLAGEAAQERASEVMATLADNPMTATMPVAMISSDTDTVRSLGELSQGLVATVRRSASADEMARRIAEIAGHLPECDGQAAGELEAEQLESLVATLRESLRSGVLTLRHDGGESAQLLLHAGRSQNQTVSDLIEKLQSLAGTPGTIRYELEESATPSISAARVDDAAPSGTLEGRRLLLVERDPARADMLAQALRAAGARISVMGADHKTLDLARELRPDVVVVDGEDVKNWAAKTLGTIRRDPWLRWASVVVVNEKRIWRDERAPDIKPIEHSVDRLLMPDRQLAERATKNERIAARLETVGPFRLLCALGDGTYRVRVQHPRIAIEVDLADGLVAGARAIRGSDESDETEGAQALATLFGLSRGRVEVKRVEAPRSTSIMAPLDVAVRLAAEELPLINPTIPPPRPTPEEAPEPVPARRSGRDVDALVGKLEELLAKLDERHVAPAAPTPPWLPIPEVALVPPPPPATERTEPTAPVLALEPGAPSPAREAPRSPQLLLLIAGAALLGFAAIVVVVVVAVVVLQNDPSEEEPVPTAAGPQQYDSQLEVEVDASAEPVAEAPEAAPEPQAPESEPEEVVALPALDPDAPIEGDPSALDLEALGVEPITRAIPPRTRIRNATRLVREGNSFRRRNRMDLAERRYLAALGYDPDNGRAISGLALVYDRRGDIETKLRLVQHLCRVRPTVYTNYLFLGDTYREAGDPVSARRAYEHAAEMAPRESAPRQRLAELGQ